MRQEGQTGKANKEREPYPLEHEPIWERQPKENHDSYRKFQKFLASEHRNLHQLAKELGVSYGGLKVLAWRWKWTERADAWDRAHLEEIVERKRRQLLQIEEGLAKAQEVLWRDLLQRLEGLVRAIEANWGKVLDSLERASAYGSRVEQEADNVPMVLPTPDGGSIEVVGRVRRSVVVPSALEAYGEALMLADRVLKMLFLGAKGHWEDWGRMPLWAESEVGRRFPDIVKLIEQAKSLRQTAEGELQWFRSTFVEGEGSGQEAGDEDEEQRSEENHH